MQRGPLMSEMHFLFFGAPVVAPDGPFFPAGLGRIVDGVDTDTVGDWSNVSYTNAPQSTRQLRAPVRSSPLQ